MSLSKNINPSLVLVQSRKTRPYITDRLLMGCKETNQTKQWLSGRVLDSRPRGCGLKHHRSHCVVSLSKAHLSLLCTGSTQEDPSRCN